MKKLILLLYTLLLTTGITYPQWNNQNPVPDGNNLWSTYFIDDNIGWIVGSNGFIKKTTNTGLDWFQQSSGTTASLKSVQFSDENTGWICGGEGLILKTTNGGQNWFELSSGVTENLTDLHFTDSNTGYVVGYNETILKTTDGGTTWVTQSIGSTFDLYSVDFLDSNLGYAVGGRDSSNFLKTTNGGVVWTRTTLDLGGLSTLILNCVEFINANDGWIGSEGQFLNHSGNISRTTDGGQTWFSTLLFGPVSRGDSELHPQEDNPIDIQRGIRSIYFKDSNNGYAVGGTRDGWWRSIFTTTDAGLTWQKKYDYSEQTGLLSVFVNNDGKGWAVGYSGVMYTTDDNGSTWSQILSGNNSLYYAGDWITSVFMVDDSLGWAAGYRKGIWFYPIILKTTTGGKIWKTNSEFGNSFDKAATDIFFLNENTGWISFYDRCSYKTTDAGVSWNTTQLSASEKYFINQDIGWAAYEPLGVFKSSDGGANWVQKSSVSMQSIYFSDLNNGWAVGDGGNILKSTDQGETWIPKTSGITSNLNSVNFYDSNIGICAGKSGTVLLSTNGGEDWASLNAGTNASLYSVVLTNSTTAWLVGAGGKILNTTDLGSSWVTHNGITESNLSSVQFINENTGWIAGDNNIIKYFDEPVSLANHFNPVWSGNGYMVMSIYVTGAELIGGGNLEAGDEIGVFDGENCVGFVKLTETIPPAEQVQIVASTDDPSTPQVDGFINGNTISYKFWLSGISLEVSEYTAIYTSGDGIFMSLGSATVEFANVLPVELISFTAVLYDNKVTLNWKTATEANNYGFDIERSSDKEDWIQLGFVEGIGTSESPVSYTFIDNNLYSSSGFYYRLKQTDNNGKFEYSSVLKVDVVPKEYSLSQNYPNPFNPSTKIRYQIPNQSKVVIKLYDILGGEVTTLLNEEKEPGLYELQIDGQNLSSGTYIYRITAGSFVDTKKMILLR
jgi:photosystem II stability/assembly factor-like uncharacterized protein